MSRVPLKIKVEKIVKICKNTRKKFSQTYEQKRQVMTFLCAVYVTHCLSVRGSFIFPHYAHQITYFWHVDTFNALVCDVSKPFSE